MFLLHHTGVKIGQSGDARIPVDSAPNRVPVCLGYALKLVLAAGADPATPCMSGRCSTVELHERRNGGLRSRDLTAPSRARYWTALHSAKWLGMMVQTHRILFQRQANYRYSNPHWKVAPKGGSAPPTSRLTVARSTD